MTHLKVETRNLQVKIADNWFLADRTKGRANGTVLRPSVCRRRRRL